MGLQLADVQKIILIGGTSSSKIVYDYWLQKTNGTSTKVIYHQPLNSVAKGAALYAASLNGNSISGGRMFQSVELKSVSTYNIGVKIGREKEIDLLIHRNSPLPITAKRLYKINPNNVSFFSLDVCQYWDEAETQLLGSIELDSSVASMGEFLLEVNLENKANGTIGLKLKNADNGRDIRFAFTRNQSKFQYNYQEQRTLIDSIFLNNFMY